MSDTPRAYPQFSACGLNCGLCPRYYTDGPSRCPGCGGAGFSARHPACGVLSCCRRNGLEVCFQCEQFPCPRYEGADQSDSFITHRNQFIDLYRAKDIGLDGYIHQLNDKMDMLCQLLAHYDDGRRKGFFCTAVNLLDTADIRAILDALRRQFDGQTPIKLRAAEAVALLQQRADAHGVDLKLRKKGR